MASKDHKIAVITGTGGYLGISIAERLIKSLPSKTRLTIVITSRTFPGVKKAVESLKQFVKSVKRDGLIEFDYLVFDQCNFISMLGAARELKLRYKHIDYLFLNSSHSQLQGIDYKQATIDFFTQPLKAFTVGTFKIQGISKKSNDGLSSVFQANVVSPWYLINEIIPLLQDGGRVIWISTSIALPEFLSEDDLGLFKNEHSYEASKYEIELLQHATYKPLFDKYKIQSWLLHPGVFKSTTFVPTLNIFAYLGMYFMFYLCRLFGSKYHCIYPEVAANAPIWAALEADVEKDDMSMKYGSATDRWGNEVLERSKLEVSSQLSEKVYEYVESIRKEWSEKLKDQIIERHLY